MRDNVLRSKRPAIAASSNAPLGPKPGLQPFTSTSQADVAAGAKSTVARDVHRRFRGGHTSDCFAKAMATQRVGRRVRANENCEYRCNNHPAPRAKAKALQRMRFGKRGEQWRTDSRAERAHETFTVWERRMLDSSTFAKALASRTYAGL